MPAARERDPINLRRVRSQAPSPIPDGSMALVRDITLTALIVVLVGVGAILRLGDLWGHEELWLVAADVGLVAAVIRTLTILRTGRLAVDIVAVFALIGTIVLNEHLAGAVVALMVCSGALMESWASHRAARGLSLLASRAPTTARRVVGDVIEVVPVADVSVGDTLWVAVGDIVPVDGHLLSPAVLDESSLTGEPLPVSRAAGESVSSGVCGTGPAFTMRAAATSEASTYSQIVQLVAHAEATSAPTARIADRWAVRFIGLTAGLTTATYFLAGGARAVSVLVIATPCPLILAAPVALISGIAVAARAGVIVKGGAALEALAHARTAVLDKTGTITVGRPHVTRIDLTAAAANRDEALSLAASVEQGSSHVLAASVVESALSRGITLRTPTAVREVPGKGVTGVVENQVVRVGTADWVGADVPPGAVTEGGTQVYVSVDQHIAATLLLADEKRADAAETLAALRASGISRMVMLTGDRDEAAREIARGLPLDEVRAHVTPADKQRIVREESAAAPTMMIGDGINDAPALAAADIGIAIAARGASAASQAADVVLVHERIAAIADARRIATRSIAIATQSVALGMALCCVGMAAAMAGWLPAPVGALAQEGIDLAAIGWALRATAIAPIRPHISAAT